MSELGEWERYASSFVVLSAGRVVGPKYEDIVNADNDRLGPPQSVVSTPSYWERYQIFRRYLTAVNPVSLPIIPLEPPKIPGLLFEGFTLRSLVKEMPSEVSDNWLLSQSNRTSQVIEGIRNQRSSIIDLGDLPHGLSMPVSPGLQSNEVFFSAASPPDELFFRLPSSREKDELFLPAISAPCSSAATLDCYPDSDSDLGERVPPPDLTWFLGCLNRELPQSG